MPERSGEIEYIDDIQLMSEATGIFKFNFQELKSSLVNALVVAVITVLYGVSIKEGFDVFSANWLEIGRMVLNASIAAFTGSIGKHLLTDNEGNTHLGVATIKTK